MDRQRWQTIERILDAALDHPPAEWPALLDNLCGADRELRVVVDDLLRRRAQIDDFMTSSVVETAAAVALSDYELDASATEGSRIGPYRLLHEIGHGGMGRIFLAERADGEFVQQVALKLLRGGLDTQERARRFRAERQILASLNHPNIARLLDGGVTDTGLPFLVMEYVQGRSIQHYCAERQLSIRTRLQLFLAVGRAVAYAHRNLIVHRDLKPDNILVTADGQVKLLDFGVAKLLTEAEASLETRAGQRWITPEYAAPEQLSGQPVTTATDVYQLGLLLYELLTDRRPFENQLGVPESLARVQNDQLPSKPSSTVGKSAANLDTARVRQLLRGDLDAIVLQALRRQPDERYLSVDALCDDVERHLAGLPVRARQGSALYQLRKFTKRHRWGVAATAAFGLLLAGYGVTLTVHARAMQRALERVEQEKMKALGGSQFMIGLFGPPQSGVRMSDTLAVRELLARGEQQADELRDQPLARAQLLSVLGVLHHTMRNFNRAGAFLDTALAIRRHALGELNVDVAESLVQLGMLTRDRGDAVAAGGLFRHALETQRKVLGDEDPALSETLDLIARLSSTPIDEAIVLAREALAISKRAYGPEHALVAENMNRLANALRRKGELAEAESLLRQGLALRRRLVGNDHRDVTRDMVQLAIVVDLKGDLDEAEQLRRGVLAIRERVYGPDHALVAAALHNVANTLAKRGQHDEAERLMRRAAAIQERTYGKEHTRLAESLALLASVLRQKGQLDEAVVLRQRELAILRNTYGNQHTIVAGSLHNLGLLQMERGLDTEAEQLLLEAKTIREKVYGVGQPQSALVQNALGTLARRRQNFPAAETIHLEVLRNLRAHGYTDAQQDVQNVHRELVLLYEAWGKPEQAAQYRAVQTRRGR